MPIGNKEVMPAASEGIRDRQHNSEVYMTTEMIDSMTPQEALNALVMDNAREDEFYERAEKVENSLATLGITADVLFARIREDLDRGLVREARGHLDFVDVLNTIAKK